jgi:hypothetical protein
MAEFIECTSLNISYDILGIATITYTIVSDTSGLKAYNELQDVGGQNFRGYVVNASVNQIQSTNWWESHVTLIATTN